MHDDAPRDIYVQPGESHLVRGPAIVRTVLGSCVGVTFWCPDHGVSAMVHPMLPRFPKKSLTEHHISAARRYVDFTIRDIAEQLDALKIPREETQVKMFGGGDVLPVNAESSRPTVGRMNCQSAIETLESVGFRVVASSLGGTCGINIHFDTRTGEVWLKRLC